MLGNGVTSFAAKNIVQAGLSTTFVTQAEKVLERIRDTPAGEEVDRDVELVFGRHIGRIAVPLENPIVDRIDVLNERYLDLQAGGRHGTADRLAELGYNHLLDFADRVERARRDIGDHKRHCDHNESDPAHCRSPFWESRFRSGRMLRACSSTIILERMPG